LSTLSLSRHTLRSCQTSLTRLKGMFVSSSNFTLSLRKRKLRNFYGKKLNKNKQNLKKKPLPCTRQSLKKKNVFAKKNKRELAKRRLPQKLPLKREVKMKSQSSMFLNFKSLKWASLSVKLETSTCERDRSTNFQLRWWRSLQLKATKSRLISVHRRRYQYTRAQTRLLSLFKRPSPAKNPRRPLWRASTELVRLDQSVASSRTALSELKRQKSLHSSQTTICKKQKWSLPATLRANRPWLRVFLSLKPG